MVAAIFDFPSSATAGERPSVGYFSFRADGVLLCDTARHERSGVQLF
jgi:hypothetical protein